MPSRKNRNAHRQSANNTPNSSYPASLLPSPALLPESLPEVELDRAREPELIPEPETLFLEERVLEPEPAREEEQEELIDVLGTSGRVRGDRESPSPRVPASPRSGAGAFDIPRLPDISGGRHDTGHVRSPVLVR